MKRKRKRCGKMDERTQDIQIQRQRQTIRGYKCRYKEIERVTDRNRQTDLWIFRQIEKSKKYSMKRGRERQIDRYLVHLTMKIC